MTESHMGNPRQLATLAGGCFWCLEAAFKQVQGVERITSGYIGGSVEAPTYEAVCRETTGHAEAVELEFDPSVIDFETLLGIFFTIHDPTTLNRQGHDVGSQYRSAIYYHDADQRQVAKTVIERLQQAGTWRHPIVTEVTEASRFWPAEAYHQDYFARHPNQGYCMAVVAPKVVKVRQQFPQRLKPLG